MEDRELLLEIDTDDQYLTTGAACVVDRGAWHAEYQLGR